MRMKKIIFISAILVFAYFISCVLTEEIKELAFLSQLIIVSCKVLMAYEKKQLKKE